MIAVDSDTNGPIVLEADTGPIAGDRMIGTFSKSGMDRLIVKVETVEHRGKGLEANGIVLAPDSMETAVASSIDEHYVERFVLPAAAAFMSGLGQAVALGNSTSTVSPFGGTTSTIGPLTFKQEALVAAGRVCDGGQQCAERGDPKGADRASRRQCLGWRDVPVEPLDQIARPLHEIGVMRSAAFGPPNLCWAFARWPAIIET